MSLTSTRASRSWKAGLHSWPAFFIGVDVVLDPAVEPLFDITSFHEAADPVARHDLEVMRETTGRHQIGQASEEMAAFAVVFGRSYFFGF